MTNATDKLSPKFTSVEFILPEHSDTIDLGRIIKDAIITIKRNGYKVDHGGWRKVE